LPVRRLGDRLRALGFPPFVRGGQGGQVKLSIRDPISTFSIHLYPTTDFEICEAQFPQNHQERRKKSLLDEQRAALRLFR
jgi:hypothetical protein